MIYFVSITTRNNYHSSGDRSKGIFHETAEYVRIADGFSKAVTIEEPKCFCCTLLGFTDILQNLLEFIV